jgi:hypothetical protein
MKFGQLMLNVSAGQTRMRQGLLVLATSLALVACGGGGGGTVATDGTVTTDGTSTGILDSFGRSVGGGSDGGGFSAGDSGADGSAGDGAPIVGGLVEVTDATGKTVTATTDKDGYYRVKVTGFTPPFVAKVTRKDGVVRYSLNVQPVKINGFVTVNISGLTDKIASDVAVAAGKTGAQELTPKIVDENRTAITKSISDLKTLFKDVIERAGLAVGTFDPLSVPFVTNRTGYDNVLDNTKVNVVNGATQLTVATIYIPPVAAVPVIKPSSFVALQGTWEMNSSGTTSPGSGVPPALAALTDLYWINSYLDAQLAIVNPQQTTGLKFSFVNVLTNPTGFTFSLKGDGSGDTAGYSSTITVTVSFSNFVGCGECGVGSSVSYSFITTTVSGTQTTPAGVTTAIPNLSTSPVSGTETWVRKS